MQHNRNIICISSIDWDFVWQGHQEIMATFAREGHRVLFIENTGIRVPTISDLPRIRKRLINWFRSFKGIRKVGERIFIYSPVILPFPYSNLAAFINRFIMLSALKKWMKAVDFASPIIWTFLPTRTALDLIRNIENELSIYYCIADFDELVKDKKKVQKTEQELIRMVDIVFAQGTILKEKCLKYNKNVSIFPFGVRDSLFDLTDGEKNISCPDEMKEIKGIRIGYVGGLHKHVDFDLIESIAFKRPGWTIVLIGPDQVNYSSREKPGNIKMLGMKRYEELPRYIHNLDVCMIPYTINEYTKTVYPTKLNEYLLVGKPVVSTALPEIEEFSRMHPGVVFIAFSKEDFLKFTEDALRRNNPEDALRRKEAAKANAWEDRIQKMSEIIEDEIAKKSACATRNWQENLAKIYHTSKKRIIKLAIATAILYFIIFYSPFVWFLARPLKISDPPEKADAIVVFGGGVGETGSPGKSTIERARFSVDLFREGFSKNIIYSSGYTYKYNDAENMKLFAISMGVPADNIILEQKANSTYENIKYTNEILKKKGFGKIILISSPYNMRRASLVFGSVAKGLKVTYVPLPDPQFYQREKPVKLEQIKAIIHEYLGIAYYFFKGYITKL